MPARGGGEAHRARGVERFGLDRVVQADPGAAALGVGLDEGVGPIAEREHRVGDPVAARCATTRSIMGRSTTGSICLGVSRVRGRRRVPNPPTRMTAFTVRRGRRGGRAARGGGAAGGPGRGASWGGPRGWPAPGSPMVRGPPTVGRSDRAVPGRGTAAEGGRRTRSPDRSSDVGEVGFGEMSGSGPPGLGRRPARRRATSCRGLAVAVLTPSSYSCRRAVKPSSVSFRPTSSRRTSQLGVACRPAGW